MLTTRIIATLLSLAAVATAVIGCAIETGEAPAQKSAEMINVPTLASGNSNAVAIYHWEKATCDPYPDLYEYWPLSDANQDDYAYDMWWPRPCSGRVIRKDGNVTFILTARHCVTDNGLPDGPITPATPQIPHILVTSKLAPGVLAATETGGRVQTTGVPTGVLAPVYFQDYAKYGDIALLRADGDLQPPQPAERRGIMAFSDSESPALVGYSILRSSGYGRATEGSCWEHQNSGAGQLRTASGWEVTALNAAKGHFTHDLQSNNSAAIAAGDSGSTMYFLNIAQGWTAIRDIGVNSSPTVAYGGTLLLPFIQDAFLRVFMVSLDKLSTNLVVGSAGTVGSVITQNYSESTYKTHANFYRDTGQLRLGTYCIRDEGAGVTAKLRACTSTRVAWTMTVPGQIKNVSSGRCLALMDDGVTLWTTTCQANSTTWTFTADHLVL